MKEREQINSIREEYSGLRDLPRESLASSVKTLAEDLYAKDTHFIFELIQNAEDNEYKPQVRPRLRFEICHQDLEGARNAALIVHNNEIGFLDKHVRALCQVGRSTKNKAQGYIGEKGIGFKSVFRITNCPYVFSNGFKFCLPEKDEPTGLGYIVPCWVENRPDGIAEGETSIILPINKIDVNAVNDALREIAPETILFLKKLFCLEISINLPDIAYEVVVEKQILRDTGISKLVELSYLLREKDGEEETVETARYWLTEVEFKKPSDVQHDKRAGIETRAVTVAIPLDHPPHDGKLFAYLPVWEQTGIPFLINADFLLVSSREGVREDEVWNKWLRDCVTKTYTAALLSLLEDHDLPLATKMSAYASIPLDSHQQFLNPIVKTIQEQLSNLNCVFVLPGVTLSQPKQARLCHENFRGVLGASDCFPLYLREEVRLACPEIQSFSKQLEAIGLQYFLLSDVKRCLEDGEWVQGHPLAWFVELYRYLSTQSFNEEDLCPLPIIPIHDDEKGICFSCEEEQPIYFPVDTQESKALASVPAWLSALVQIGFLHPDFSNVLDQQEDTKELKQWLTETLAIYSFSMKNYCVAVLAKLADYYGQLADDQIVEASTFLFQHGDMKVADWESLPIILSDGRKMLLQDARKLQLTETSEQIQDIVVPEGFDPVAGWQHIWPTEEDRAHFVALADAYMSMPEKWFSSLKVTFYPGFRQIAYENISSYDLNYLGCQSIPTEPERTLYTICFNKATGSRRQKTRVVSFTLPSAFDNIRGQVGCSLSKSILAWLKHFPPISEYSWNGPGMALHKVGLSAWGTYQYRGRNNEYRDSWLLDQLRYAPWLPSTKGLVCPYQAFIDKPGIREVLGDKVPYFTDTLPEPLLKLLGVKSDLTILELIRLLKENSGRQDMDPTLPPRIYTELEHRSHFDAQKIRDAFSGKALIYTEDSRHNVKWCNRDECIWEDVTGVFGDDFICLERQYPKLKEFFIDLVGIKERIDTECFARQWLKLQDAPLSDLEKQRERVERILRKIKPDAVSSPRPGWWQFFSNKAKLYSQSDTFCLPNELVLPDDGELQKVFKGHDGIEFAWRPVSDAFSDWGPFYKTFKVPLLSESVTEFLEQGLSYSSLEVNQFMTAAAVKMIAAWLRENNKGEYERLFAEGVFHQLYSMKEAITQESIQVEFRLSTASYSYDPKIESYPVFWDRTDNNMLIYQNNAERSLIAKSLAKGLLTAYKNLAHWIELVLGASSTERLRGENWSVPQEILDLCGNNKFDQSGHTSPVNSIIQPDERAENELPRGNPANHKQYNNPATSEILPTQHQNNTAKSLDATGIAEPTDGDATIAPRNKSIAAKGGVGAQNTQQSKENDCQTETPARSNGSQGAAVNVNFGAEVNKAFNKDGKTEINDESQGLGRGTIKNPELRSKRQSESHRINIDREPSPVDRRRATELSLLEGPNEAVRSSLYEWYRGRCQICEETWPKHNGEAFFVAAYLVDRRNARWLDEPANAICLCAKHFAQWRHAAKEESEDVISQISKLRLKAEGGDGELSLHFRMFNENYTISYDERHFLSLRTLLEVTKKMESPSSCFSE